MSHIEFIGCYYLTCLINRFNPGDEYDLKLNFESYCLRDNPDLVKQIEDTYDKLIKKGTL